MIKFLKRVKNEWNKAVGVPTPEKPTHLHRDQSMLMFRLLYEELLEYKDAVQDEELTENERQVLVLDALCDINFLLNGTVSQWGFEEVWEDANYEVFRSNLSKLKSGKLLKREDGKVLKPEGYFPPNLKQFLCD